MNQSKTLKPSPTALLNPCVDPIFKILFTDESEEAHQALTCFLSDIFGKPVSDVTLQPNELSGESTSDKQSEFDINCVLEGKKINIEMQGLNHSKNFGNRIEYHAAHLLNHYVPKGTKWEDVPQVFQISVLNFFFDENEKNSLSHYTFKNENGRPVAERMHIIFMELPKIKALPDDISLLTPAQMWGKFFLDAPDKEKNAFIEELSNANRGIKMAVTVLKNISQDEINWYHESRYWMHVSDEKSMISSAFKEGQESKAIEDAKKLLADGKYTAEEISELLKIPVETFV
ncbi:MAG: Rpn family recombination-promoting nuclease/putative transposase [Treponema sp.]|nr:Rpn family recombination-promoting nuclease/putative transposase [Treponema sp.]